MPDTDDAQLLQLTTVIEQLEQAPDNVPLIRQQISLMSSLGMEQEVVDATLRLASLVMLDEGERKLYDWADFRYLARTAGCIDKYSSQASDS